MELDPKNPMSSQEGLSPVEILDNLPEGIHVSQNVINEIYNKNQEGDIYSEGGVAKVLSDIWGDQHVLVGFTEDQTRDIREINTEGVTSAEDSTYLLELAQNLTGNLTRVVAEHAGTSDPEFLGNDDAV